MPARLRAALEGRTTLRKKLALNSEMPPRRRFLQTTLLGGVGTAILPALAGARELADTSTPAAQGRPFELDELTIADLQAGMNSGKFSSRSLVEKYQARIEEIDRQGPAGNSVIEINPEAQPFQQRVERPWRTDEEPVCARSQSVRLEFRLGSGGRGQPLCRRDRHRDGWIGGLSIFGEWDCRHQADARSRESRRHHPDRA